MSIQKHLEKYYNVSNKEDVEEIALDNVKMSEISTSDKELLEKYSGVQKLSMNYCGLKYLNNLPNFPQLETVIL